MQDKLMIRLPGRNSNLILEVWLEPDGTTRFEVKPDGKGSEKHDGFYEEFRFDRQTAELFANTLGLFVETVEAR